MERPTKKVCVDKYESLRRPELSHPGVGRDTFDFFCTEVTQTHNENGPVLRLWGVNDAGNSVCVKVNDFLPYFYAYKDQNVFDIHTLEKRLRETVKGAEQKPIVVSTEEQQKMLLMGYHTEKSTVYKITLSAVKYVTPARELLKNAGIPTYEGSVPFPLRFMVDKGFGGCHWLRVTPSNPLSNPPASAGGFGGRVGGESTSQIEVFAQTKNISVLKDRVEIPEGYRTLYFDLEILKAGKGFQGPDVDPIIIISSVLVNGKGEILDRRVFYSLDDKTHDVTLPPPTHVEKFYNESAMIMAWAQYVQACQPDLFSGYNTDGYDWNYLFNRTFALNKDLHNEFVQMMSRDPNKPLKIKAKTFQSAATGARKDYDVNIEGCVSFDLLKAVKAPANMIKSRSYTLGAILQKLLKKNKVEMPYRLIPSYHRGTNEQRSHLAHYAEWDSESCHEIVQNQMFIPTYVERARVCGVPFKFLTTRGQQILVLSLLLRRCQQLGILVPSSTEVENNEETEGATVLEPDLGIHKDPVITLDFGSLYPSIIQEENICYSTVAPLEWLRRNLQPDQYVVPPEIANCGFGFVVEEVCEGVLPQIERVLAAERNATKELMKQEKDPNRKAIYDKRQLAIKLCMNSIYGFMKANMVCDKRLMDAVTAFGRHMIKTTKYIVEKSFDKCKVIYGDTDSVFCKFIGRTLVEAFELGDQAAKLCTTHFNEKRTGKGKRPIHNLVREKGFQPFLSVGKKKYVGRKFLLPTDNPTKPTSSGLENVRRDNALIASETQAECLQMLLIEGDITGERAVKHVHQKLRDLLCGRIPISKLIISKNLSKSFQHYEDNCSKHPHVELAKKIEARKHLTGEQGYYTGDRVPFVVVGSLKGTKMASSAEDPAYALKNRLPIDYKYYVERQMMKPLMRIFACMFYPDEKLHKLNSKGDKVPLTEIQLKKLKTYKLLFEGPHMGRVVRKMQPGGPGISSFVTKTSEPCVRCNCPLNPSDTQGHCTACKPYIQHTILAMEQEHRELEWKRWNYWTTCQRCVGEKYTENVVCENTDCPNFFEREQVLFDIEDLDKKIKSLF